MKTFSLLNSLLGIIIFSLALTLCLPTVTKAQRKGGPPPNKHIKHKKVKAKHLAHYNYRHLPKRGLVVTTIPADTKLIKYNNAGFYFRNGVFYKPLGAASFVVVRAPLGIRINALPPGHRKIVMGTAIYYYHYGTYYSKSPDAEEYEVVEPPEGAEVDALPEGYESETIDGVTYYTLDDVRYMEQEKEVGTVYKVVKVKK